jgi:flagellar FliJ protein
MKKFKYSLDKVLDFKINAEKDKKEMFSKLKMKVEEEEEKLLELSSILQNKFLNINDSGNTDGIDFKNSYSYIYTLQGKIKRQEELINQYKNKLEISRQQFIYAQKERKTLEMLKEKAYLEYITEVEREEQKLNDELGLYAYLRRRNDLIKEV